MIIKKLLELCLSLLTSLLSNVGSIPALPEQILTIFQTVINYMVSGIDLLGLFIGPTALTFIGVCLDVIIALNLFYFGYSCVMWFVKKIPFLGIKQPFAPDLRKQRGQRLFPALCFWGFPVFSFSTLASPVPCKSGFARCALRPPQAMRKEGVDCVARNSVFLCFSAYYKIAGLRQAILQFLQVLQVYQYGILYFCLFCTIFLSNLWFDKAVILC